MLIALQGMRGERPAVDARQLGYNEAQVAENCKLWRGVIEPWYAPKLEQAAVNAGPLKSIYRLPAGQWPHWATDVDVIRGPIAGTTRYYWTGQGAPRVGNVETIAGVSAMTTNAPGAQNFVLVNNALGFAAGHSISIQLDAGGSHTTTITTIQLSLNRLNLSAALPSQASAGKIVTNNNKGYPHGSYLLGVPAPSNAPTTAIDTSQNQGTIVSVAGFLGQQTGSTASPSSTFSIDLANIDSDGRLIDFEFHASVTGQIVSVQNGKIRIKVIRDPGSANETIYETVFDATFQGPQNSVLPPGFPSPDQLEWASNEALIAHHTMLLQAQSPFETGPQATSTNFHFQYAPSDGNHTYRLTVSHEFSAAASAPNWTYSLRLTARFEGGFGIQLNTASHGLKEGDTVQFAGIVGTGSLVDLNKAPVTVTDVNGATILVDSEASGTYTSGGTWKQVWDEEDLEARTYAYTYVATIDGNDMEGPPSNASASLLAGDNQVVTVSALIDPATLADGRPYSSIRIYRLAVGSETEQFQFVAQVALNAGSFSDTVRGTDLDEALPSQYTSGGSLVRWDPPPADMQGIIELPNGLAAGFRGNELLLCEPYQLHAWPGAYRHTMHDEITGIGAFGASIFVGTKGRPVIATGIDPSTLSEEHIEVVHPCESKRGIVDMGYAILYPSKTGLVMVAQGQADIVTNDLFTDNQWQALNPSSFVATKYGHRYMWFYDNGTDRGGYILDPKNPTSTLARMDLYVTEVWTDPRTDELYLVIVNAQGQEEIVKWEGDKGGIPFRWRWRSKEFTSRIQTSMSVVKIDAEHYPVTVNVYCDGALYDSVDVFSEEPERISDALGEGRKWELEVVGNTEVEAAYAASNMQELTRYLSGVA